MVAPPAYEPGQDTPAIFFRLLTVWRWVSRRFWQRVRPTPRVSPLHSQVAFYSQSSGVVFNIASLRKVFTEHAESTCPSRRARSFCPPFGVFRLADPDFFLVTARVARIVLMHSSNRLPSG